MSRKTFLRQPLDHAAQSEDQTGGEVDDSLRIGVTIEVRSIRTGDLLRNSSPMRRASLVRGGQDHRAPGTRASHAMRESASSPRPQPPGPGTGGLRCRGMPRTATRSVVLHGSRQGARCPLVSVYHVLDQSKVQVAILWIAPDICPPAWWCEQRCWFRKTARLSADLADSGGPFAARPLCVKATRATGDYQQRRADSYVSRPQLSPPSRS